LPSAAIQDPRCISLDLFFLLLDPGKLFPIALPAGTSGTRTGKQPQHQPMCDCERSHSWIHRCRHQWSSSDTRQVSQWYRSRLVKTLSARVISCDLVPKILSGCRGCKFRPLQNQASLTGDVFAAPLGQAFHLAAQFLSLLTGERLMSRNFSWKIAACQPASFCLDGKGVG
jgi:hypothetical protein